MTGDSVGSVMLLFRWGRKHLHYFMANYCTHYVPNFIRISPVL